MDKVTAEAILELRGTYDYAKLRSQWRRLCAEYHPDKSVTTGMSAGASNDALKLINEAFSYLKSFVEDGNTATSSYVEQGSDELDFASLYDLATVKMENATSFQEYEEARAVFEILGQYRDSQTMAHRCSQRIDEMKCKADDKSVPGGSVAFSTNSGHVDTSMKNDELKQSAMSEKPFLEKWNTTSIGMATLGLLFPIPTIVYSLALLISNALISYASTTHNNVMFFVAVVSVSLEMIAYLYCCFRYATKIYPSLYSSNPKIQSPKAIAYWNMAFGGPIFGPIWNIALTKKKETKSTNIYALLIMLGSAGAIISLIWCIFAGIAYAPANNDIATTEITNTGFKTYVVYSYYDLDTDQLLDATGTVTVSKSEIDIYATVNSEDLTSSGEYVGEEDGYAKYETDDGAYVYYGEESGQKFLIVINDDTQVSYGLIIG